MSSVKKTKKSSRKNLSNRSGRIGKLLMIAGGICILLSLIILTVIFSPVISNELTFRFGSRKPVRVELTSTQTNDTVDIMIPKDEDAGIVIPKIHANASVVWEVDPYDEKIYQQALTKGVAHASGSAYPGEAGNVFIFSHSSQDFLTANRYNSVFYLLSKLGESDEIYLFYRGKPYVYRVTGSRIIHPDDVSLLTKKNDRKELTLMTCWPPGTTFKRLIVEAGMD